MNAALKSDDAERQDAIKKGNAIFAFTLTNAQGQTKSWYLDLKDKGVIGEGAAPAGGKADGELALSPPLNFPTPFNSPTCMLHPLPNIETGANHFCSPHSYPPALRRGLQRPGLRQGQRPAPVHGRQAQDPRQHHEGDQDGADPEEGADQGQAVSLFSVFAGVDLQGCWILRLVCCFSFG